MYYLKEWPRLLLTLPNKVRIGLLTLCIVLCLGIHILTFPISHNGSLLIIPLALAAWMFKKRGLLVCALTEVPVMVAYYSISFKSIWWPFSFALFFWGGAFILLFIGYIIVIVRILVDSAEEARQKAEQAGQLMAIAYDQQLQLNRLKDHFITHVSHELRTPLTVLGGYLELLKTQDEHPNSMLQSHLLTEAMTSYEELMSLVNRVLEATTVAKECLSAHYEAISVRKVVQEVLANLNPADAQAYTIRLQVAEQVMVWADPQYLRQVVGHLLSNIFKYVPKQTQVSIETSQPDPSSPVCLSVQDAGPGIPPEEVPLLFEKCVRLKRDLAGPTSGMGLGLSICKHLVETMGGHIWVESSGCAGEGSRFCLTLPPSLLSPICSSGNLSGPQVKVAQI